MKKTIIISGLLLIIVIGLSVFFIFSRGNNSETPVAPVGPTAGALGNVNVPSQADAPSVLNFPNAPQGPTFTLGTPQGLVTVNNFYNMPLVLDEEFLILENTNDYQITFDTENEQFFIYASSSPLEAAQQKGEAAFLALLGVSQQDACKLNVLEGFPQGSSLANEQPHLSFCSSGGAFQAR